MEIIKRMFACVIVGTFWSAIILLFIMCIRDNGIWGPFEYIIMPIFLGAAVGGCVAWSVIKLYEEP